MDHITEAVLETLIKVAQKYKKPWCYPARKLILVLLEKYKRIYISMRTLDRRLKFLKDGQYISRMLRHRRLKDGTFAPGSTLTKILGRGFYHVARTMKRGMGIFSFYRLPKMAHNMFKTTDYLSLVDKLRACNEKFVHQRNDATVFSRA